MTFRESRKKDKAYRSIFLIYIKILIVLFSRNVYLGSFRSQWVVRAEVDVHSILVVHNPTNTRKWRVHRALLLVEGSSLQSFRKWAGIRKEADVTDAEVTATCSRKLTQLCKTSAKLH